MRIMIIISRKLLACEGDAHEPEEPDPLPELVDLVHVLSAIIYYTVLYYTILYYTTPHYTILYYNLAACKGALRTSVSTLE